MPFITVHTATGFEMQVNAHQILRFYTLGGNTVIVQPGSADLQVTESFDQIRQAVTSAYQRTKV